MIVNKAFERIFLGYAMIFMDLNIFIDVMPDILGYHLIATGWNDLCENAPVGLEENSRVGVRLLARTFMVIAIAEEIYRLMGGGGTGSGGLGIFDVTVPETPPLFRLRWTVILSMALFVAGIWLMMQIFSASRNVAAAEGKTQVTRGLERSMGLLKGIYAPIGMIIIFMEQCLNLPDTFWGNLIHGFQELGTLIYFCFQLMLVLQIANLRKNLDCCRVAEQGNSI